MIFTACSPKNSQNVFMQSLPLYASCWFSMLLNDDNNKWWISNNSLVLVFLFDMANTILFIWWNMFAYFCCRWFFRIIFALINLSIIHSRSAEMMNGALSHFWNWLNPSILVSSEGIFTLQKCLFLHAFFCDSSLFFVLK